MYAPNYDRERENAGFRWYVASTHYALLELLGVPIRSFNLEPEVGIELFRHRHLIREIFGPDVGLPAITTPPISYGHLNALGYELVFPDGGEVNYVHEDRSLQECIALCSAQIQHASAGMAPFYLEYRRLLQDAFPGQNVGFSFSSEGPLTTAYELRGMAAFLDPYDEPRLFRELLDRAVESIAEFQRFLRRVTGQPEFSSAGAGLYDDVAAMYPPSLWPELVLPVWDAAYRQMTDGRRMVHSEDLTAAHLPHLEEVGIVDYDPSISHKLNPRLIRERCRVPFRWRMGSFHFPLLSDTEVADWVYQAAADGSSCLFCYVTSGLLDEASVRKVLTLVRAARTASDMLGRGAAREELAGMVSPAGRERFWSRWPRAQEA